MSRRLPLLLFAGLLLLTSAPRGIADDAQAAAPLQVTLRTRAKADDASAGDVVRLQVAEWSPRQTAIIICDMWDDHYCVSAAKRVAEMAPRMNEVIRAARERGVLIVHSPSGCMDVYKDTPQRKLAQAAPPVKLKVEPQRWCYLDEKLEGKLPIDDSEPCDDEHPRERKRFYTRENEALQIAEGDAISDSVEVLYLLEQRGIKNVILMGVHTNMCVLGRPFGIRQLVYQGKNVVLMRDMTDSMYNPKMEPHVSHFRGTELVIEHIERHWCPTVTSTDFTGKEPFRFANDARPRVALIVGGGEYDADETIPPFAHELRDRYGCYCDVLLGRGKDADYQIPGLAALKKADVAVLFARRRALPPAQLQLLRDYLSAGKPLVALRTSSHAFAAGDKAPQELAQWPKFDQEVLGCRYHGHAPPKLGSDVTTVADAADHPILAGLDRAPWHSAGSLYGSDLLDPSATVLLRGTTGDNTQPVAWTRRHKGGRVFYTSLGHPEDFAQPQFRAMLARAIYWAMDEPLVERGK